MGDAAKLNDLAARLVAVGRERDEAREEADRHRARADASDEGFLDAEQHALAAEERCRALEAALREDADVFDAYAARHSSKGTEDGDRKAAANRAHAERLRALLSAPEAGPGSSMGWCKHGNTECLEDECNGRGAPEAGELADRMRDIRTAMDRARQALAGLAAPPAAGPIFPAADGSIHDTPQWVDGPILSGVAWHRRVNEEARKRTGTPATSPGPVAGTPWRAEERDWELVMLQRAVHDAAYDDHEGEGMAYVSAALLERIAARLSAPVASEAVAAAARALVAKLDAVTRYINAEATFAHVHGRRYDGPTYGSEMEALRGALAGVHGTEGDEAPCEPST